MKYNPDIHHHKSIRIGKHDYTRSGIYFMTICIQNRECVFCKIANGDAQVTQWGAIALNEWLAAPQHRSNVVLHEYVLMPNHFHGIVEIAKDKDFNSLDTARRVPTNREEKFGAPVAGSVPTLMRAYKAAVTKRIRQNGGDAFQWQRGYYEHIIRDEKDYIRIAEYINNNPSNWKEDRFYDERL
ncbi:MAG: hypothetical protein LBS96_06985 [Oscillospiraceae bacterium]|jgi:REP element-mobilizing transposase RayT|nr:hypothetical protein [Oscillospiraceae bacterium]